MQQPMQQGGPRLGLGEVDAVAAAAAAAAARRLQLHLVGQRSWKHWQLHAHAPATEGACLRVCARV